jgi:PAS domain S-box-containing protein
VLLAIVSVITFGGWLRIEENHVSVVFVTIPFIVWLAYQFGQRGATIGIIILSTVAIIATLNGYGPFALQSLNKSLLLLQAFIGVVITTSLLLAAVVTERKKAEDDIKLVNESLEYRIAERTEELKEKNVTLSKDITARKQVEERLKDSLEQSRVWLDSSPVCTKVVDLDFNLKYMSAAGIKALKIDDVTKFYGTPYPFDFFPESFKKSMTKNLEKVKKTGEVITGEAPICDIEGNELWFQATLVPVRDDEGRIDFIIIVSVDINEHKKMEEALIQSEKLKSIGTITAGISHEFNNILAIISGNVQLLQKTYNDHGGLTKVLCTIKRAVDDGAQISSKMLGFTKTKQDTKKLVFSDIRDLIMQSIEFTMPRWKNEAQATGISYSMDMEDVKNVSSILCNPTELREVFINLIINALDAMPEGGRISFILVTKRN